MYDAIIVGASCAGSPLAMLLAQRGGRVLLVDKSVFPRNVLSTHYIHQPGVLRLSRWGLLNEVRGTGCPAVRRLLMDFGPVCLSGAPPAAEGISEAFAPRRYLLDQILCQAARRAGAEVRQGFKVEELLTESGRVTGIRGRSRGSGPPVAERARVVIGADGQYSMVAKAVQARAYNERPPLSCSYYSYWSGLSIGEFQFYQLERMAIVVIPTNDELSCIWVGWKPQEFARVRSDVEKSFFQAIGCVPGLADRVRQGRREEPFAGTAGLPNYFRKPFGPGWALLGDAGYLKDPATGQGISDAFRDAELLADALGEGFCGNRPLAQSLARYERLRNKAARPIYEMVCRYASLDPPPALIIQFLKGLRGDQPEADRLAGTIAGTVTSRQFYSARRLARVLARRLWKGLAQAIRSEKQQAAVPREGGLNLNPSGRTDDC